MSATSGGQYYVRVRGRVQGPFELSRLKVLRSRGQFSRVFEVSEDGHSWVSSESLAELLDPTPLPAPVVEQPDASQSRRGAQGGNAHPFSTDDRLDDWGPRRKRKSESNLGTILLVLMLVIVPAGIVGGIVLMQRLDQGRAAEAVAGDSTEEDASDAGSTVEPVASLRGNASFEYWSQFHAARGKLDWGEETSAADVASRLTATSNEAAALPTQGVDPEAVAVVLDYSLALARLATAIRSASDPETYLEAFIRGADGDPFGKALEMKSSKDAAMREIADVEQRVVRVRAALTSTYGRQFP